MLPGHLSQDFRVFSHLQNEPRRWLGLLGKPSRDGEFFRGGFLFFVRSAPQIFRNRLEESKTAQTFCAHVTRRRNQHLEEKKKKLVLSATAALVLASAPPAFAADTIGRISYLAPDGKMLILEGQTEYKIAPGVDVSKHGAAEFVRLTLNDNGEVTAFSPGPASQAAYWVGKVGPQS